MVATAIHWLWHICDGIPIVNDPCDYQLTGEAYAEFIAARASAIISLGAAV
jgi:hypothetical protein